MTESKREMNREYESKLKLFKVLDRTNGEIISLPVCYAKAITHTRKPVRTEDEIEPMLRNTIECSSCPFAISCFWLTVIDLLDQQLMFLRMLGDRNGFAKSSK